MTRTTRIARAVACAALLAAPAAGMATGDATIRAEGPGGTVLPERSANVPTGGTSTLVDPDTGVTTVVPNNRATSFLLRSAEDAGVSIGFRVFSFSGVPSAFIMRIGAEASPTDWSWSWAIKVNHAVAQVGSDDVVIRPGDQILWMPSTYGVPLSELDVIAPTSPRQVGEAFTVRVNRYDDTAARTPGSGVTVTYGGRSVTTDAAGDATLTALPGWSDVVVTAPGSIRDSARTCGFAPENPETCGLDPLTPRLRDVVPNESIASTPTSILTRVTTTTGKSVQVDITIPLRGQPPTRISDADITGSPLTRSERREVLGDLGSSLAWQLNHRAGNGDATVRPPRGTTWRAAWIGGTVTVSPLARGEAIVTQRSMSRRSAATAADVATGTNRRLDACGLATRAMTTTRFGYAMVVVKAPATGARRCLAQG